MMDRVTQETTLYAKWIKNQDPVNPNPDTISPNPDTTKPTLPSTGITSLLGLGSGIVVAGAIILKRKEF